MKQILKFLQVCMLDLQNPSCYCACAFLMTSVQMGYFCHIMKAYLLGVTRTQNLSEESILYYNCCAI